MKRVKTIIALVLVIATTLSANIYAVEDDNLLRICQLYTN